MVGTVILSSVPAVDSVSTTICIDEELLASVSVLALRSIKVLLAALLELDNLAMSKLFMYVLDKVVWMLLITALTTQALQIAGILESPKGLQDISYRQHNEYNLQFSVNGETRGKRETAERSKIIDSLFNIPIQTLTAVNNLVQNSRPALRSLRDFAIKRFRKPKTTTTATEPAESNVHKRSYPVYVRPKEDKANYTVDSP